MIRKLTRKSNYLRNHPGPNRYYLLISALLPDFLFKWKSRISEIKTDRSHRYSNAVKEAFTHRNLMLFNSVTYTI